MRTKNRLFIYLTFISFICIYLFIRLSVVSDWKGIYYFSIFAADPKYRRAKTRKTNIFLS